MAVTLQRCINAMATAAGRPLTDDEMIRVAERLQERVERLRRGRGSASDNELLREAAGQLRDEANEAAALLRRSAMLQAARYASIRGYVERFADPSEGLRALLGGLNTPGAPSRFSVDYRGKALADEWTGALIAGLRQASPDDRLLTAFMRGRLDREIAQALWQTPAGPVPVPAANGSNDAQVIGAVLHNLQETSRLRANRAGAWIGALPGYVVRQSHDPLRLRRAGFEAWRDAIRPLLDDRTFERAQARVDQLEAVRAEAQRDLAQATADTRALPRALEPFARRLRDQLEINQVAGVQRDTFEQIAQRIDRLVATVDDRDLQRQARRLHRDAARALERMDRAAGKTEGLSNLLTSMVDDINSIADRRRRAEARVQASELGLQDLEYRGRADDPEAFLREVYNDIISGRMLTPQANGSYVAGAGGSSNVAMRISRERVLHFRDADAWLQYHEAYGKAGNLAAAAVDGLQRLGRHTALIETLGPNPVANFERARLHFEEAHRDNPDALIRLRSSKLDHLLRYLTGETTSPENPTVAAIGAVVRGFNVITKLGGMVISSVTDTAMMAAEARFQGRGWLDGYRQGVENLLHGRGSGDRRLISELAGAGLEGMTGAIGARLGAVDSLPGFMSWAVRKMYALNLGAWWTDSHKIGATMMQMRAWAIDQASPFGQLGEEQRRLFGLYGIGETEWNLLRASQAMDANGRAYLVPGEMRTLPTDTVSQIVGRTLTDFEAVRILDEAGDRFATLLADRADYAVPTPGAREMAMMYGGHRPGSAWGETARFFWQFKQFPVSILTKPVSNMRSHAESRAQAATSIAALFLQMTAMGYVVMSLKDVLKNKEPRHPDEWGTWLAAAAQGGGLGIYGDFLFGEYNRYGHGWLGTFAGPTASTLDEIAGFNAKILRGEVKASDAIRFGVQNVPFASLFYVKPVLDQITMAEIYERLNPGYRQRVERDMQRREGRGYLFHP